MSKSLLILGGVLPAVQLLRRMEKIVDNIHVIAHENDMIVLSKYGKKITYQSVSDCLPILKKWINDHHSDCNEWIIIPCSELFIQYIHHFRENGFEVFAQSNENLNIFSNKINMYSWLKSLDISISDFSTLSNDLDFSSSKKYIIKCSKASENYIPPFKTKTIYSHYELQKLRTIIPRDNWDNFVIQPLFKKNKSISYGGVWNNGIEIAGLIVNQVRQYPQGITSCAARLEECEAKKTITEVISKISNNVCLHGFIELEFIQNEAGIYPIDLNPRLWGWSNFLISSYPDIPEKILTNNISNISVDLGFNSWCNIWRDLPACFKISKSFWEFLTLLISLLKVTRKDFISLNDIKPEFNGVFNKLRKGK
ncbi:hypothetical protein [Acinetobacter sp. YH12201]|uniref:hypothetical protein n=1 Tax=Acinetobacter sp. YH12201 TaxID=2601140 RepID=UPI0015D415DF|nr:hypothetical protein [Acinetobacter sp. YH12201]